MSIWNSETPGVLVIMSAYNVEPYIVRTLMSIEKAMMGHNWVLVVGDDGSEDKTAEILSNYKSTAKHYIFKKFGKASSVGQAKNRVVKMALQFKQEYEAVVFMDADDIMGDRVNWLLPYAVKNDYIGVIGDHVRIGSKYGDHLRYFSARENAAFLAHFGPWTTVFHSSLLPDDGKLFREDVYGFDDGSLFARWLSEGIIFKSRPGKVVHYYQRRDGTIYTPKDRKLDQLVQKKFRDVQFEYFYGKKIDLGLPTKLSFYTNFGDGDEPKKFLAALKQNLEVFTSHPEIEFIIVDTSKTLLSETILKYPYAREIACGVIKQVRGLGLPEVIINQRIVDVAKGEKICFMPNDFVLNSFLIGKLLSTEVKTVVCENSVVMQNREFMKERAK
jgi:glycosyltransferase involved in cell wall biosynthesis